MKTAAAVLCALAVAVIAQNMRPDPVIRLKVLAPKPGTYKAYYAKAANPFFSEELTEMLQLTEPGRVVDLDFTPPRETLAAMRIDLGYAPEIVEIHGVQLVWHGLPLRRWLAADVPKLLAPTSQIGSLRFVDGVTRVEGVGPDPFATVTPAFLEGLGEWPDRVSQAVRLCSIGAGVLCFLIWWAGERIARRGRRPSLEDAVPARRRGRRHAKTAAALLFTVGAVAFASNAPPELVIRLKVLATQPGTYKAYWAKASRPSYSEEFTEALPLDDAGRVVDLDFTPPKDPLAAIRLDLGYAPAVVEIHGVQLVWRGMALRQWTGQDILQILLPTSQIGSIKVIDGVAKVEGVGPDPFATVTPKFIEALGEWPQRVKRTLLISAFAGGVLLWIVWGTVESVGRRRWTQALLDRAWDPSAVGPPEAGGADQRLNWLIPILFACFYTATFALGGFDRGFYSIDGKVEFDQMRAILDGNLRLLVAPTKHLGISLVELPLYLLGSATTPLFGADAGLVAARLANVLVTALTALVFFRLARLYASSRGAALLTLLFGFGTTAWPHSKGDTTDPVLTLCLVASFWCLAEYSRTGARKWFVCFLVAAAGTLASKLVAHVFLAGWLLHLLLVRFRRRESWSQFAAKAAAVVLLWVAALPLSLSVYRNSPAYAPGTWTFLEGIGYKIALRTVSFLDGALWYGPLLVVAAFGWRRLARRAPGDAAVIACLFLPYFAPLVLGKDVVSLHDFGSRYDLIYTPLLLLGLIPVLERLARAGRPAQVAGFLVMLAAVYVQILGSSVSILYYVNAAGGALGPTIMDRVFDWQITPFGVNPLLIVRALTGVEAPLDRFGINNVAGSIDGPFSFDFFWASTTDPLWQGVAIGLFVIAAACVVWVMRASGLMPLLRRRAAGMAAITAAVAAAWFWYFTPAQALRHAAMAPVLDSTMTPPAAGSPSSLPEGWVLNDIGVDGGGAPMVRLAPAPSGVQVSILKDYVMMSLSATPPFPVRAGDVLEGSVRATTDHPAVPVRVRFGFIRDQNAFYYSATTEVRPAGPGWRQYTTRVVVPEGAKRAVFQAVVWGGGMTTADSVVFTDARVTRAAGR